MNITEITLIINTLALLFVLYRTYLAKESVDLTKKSIDNSTIQRQLESLPENFIIIRVQTILESWINDLNKRKYKLKEILEKKDNNALKNLSDRALENPEDLILDDYLYENTPVWLKEILIAGAQYYFNAEGSIKHIYMRDKPRHNYIKDFLLPRINESLNALKELLKLIDNMIPKVILNRPDSIQSKRFFKDSS